MTNSSIFGFISFLISSLCVFTSSGQGSVSISDYYGTWRWTNGNNKDTFLIILMPNKKDSALMPEIPKVSGYHRFVQKGWLVESNLAEINSSKDARSIRGGLKDAKLLIVFHDFTRNTTFTGTFEIIPGNRKKAIWDVAKDSEKIHLMGLGEREYPIGQTVPSNIVLEKIN